MLLIRVAETETGWTWFQMRKVLSMVDMDILESKAGEICMRSPLRSQVKGLFKKLRLNPFGSKIPQTGLLWAFEPASLSL